MKRREILTKSAAGVAAGAVAAMVPKWALPTIQPAPPAQTREALRRLWRLAELSMFYGEKHRALEILRGAADAAADLDSETQADIFERIQQVREYLDGDLRYLADDRKELESDPASLNKWFNLADRLQSLGQYKEAEANYRMVFGRERELLAEENAHLWPRAGMYHFRRGRYREAAGWFERTPGTLPLIKGPGHTPEEILLRNLEGDTTLNRVLAAAALGNKERARDLAQLYISKAGRIPWPYGWYLFQAGIDADSMYIQASRKAAAT